MKQKINIGNKEIKISVDYDKKTVVINEIEFKELTDFVYLVNKLTDIAEALLNE